jgi:hypothetical protein
MTVQNYELFGAYVDWHPDFEPYYLVVGVIFFAILANLANLRKSQRNILKKIGELAFRLFGLILFSIPIFLIFDTLIRLL